MDSKRCSMEGAFVGAGAAGAAAMAFVAAAIVLVAIAIALVAIVFVSSARSVVTLNAVTAIKAIVRKYFFILFFR
jgi:hypothetical protein